MKFRTEIKIDRAGANITHDQILMLVGSCFTENIGDKLKLSGFKADVNPFGIVYNPVSVVETLIEIVENKVYSMADLVESKGLWHSFRHHGSFSGHDPEMVLMNINNRISKAHDNLHNAGYLLVTLGTSHVFRLRETGAVVANCHKFPSNIFESSYLSQAEIAAGLTNLVENMRRFNPSLKLVFSISPVRYLKDGAVANSLSKALMLVVINDLMSKFEDVFYFPSYEIMIDDLRDYRFYSDDLLHPSKMAIDYIWQKFSDTFFTGETKKVVNEVEQIRKMLSHRLLNPGSAESIDFGKRRDELIREFEARNPGIEIESS